MQLFIGNKNYSSWSMRPWVLMRHFDIPFEEVKVRFDSFSASSLFKQTILEVTPVGKVPTLRDGKLVVWDTLAIAEYLAETYADKHLWPQDKAQRARARSLCAEMHSGFSALRTHCGMNIEARLQHIGAEKMQNEAGVQADVARLNAMWNEQLAQSGGPYLFGDFSIADAFFAPVVMRFVTYGLPAQGAAAQYIDNICNTPAVAAWIKDAMTEEDFLPFEEPYRQHR